MILLKPTTLFQDPTLFKIYLNKASRDGEDPAKMQLTDDLTLYTYHFADDQTILAQEKKDLEFR